MVADEHDQQPARTVGHIVAPDGVTGDNIQPAFEGQGASVPNSIMLDSVRDMDVS